MRLFLAPPFTSCLTRDADDSHRLDAGLRALLQKVESALVGAGRTIFPAQPREEFGAKLRPPRQCTPFDFVEMHRARGGRLGPRPL